jgi:hypothetical protein
LEFSSIISVWKLKYNILVVLKSIFWPYRLAIGKRCSVVLIIIKNLETSFLKLNARLIAFVNWVVEYSVRVINKLKLLEAKNTVL